MSMFKATDIHAYKNETNFRQLWLRLIPVTIGMMFLGLAAPLSLAQTEPLPELSPAFATASNVSLLKSGDQVEITVVGFPELSGLQRLTSDGTIQLPLAGSILLSGLTLAQATEQIAMALRPYVRRPQVSVALLSVRPPSISVTGEVRRPGPYLVVPPNLPESDFSDLTGGDFQTLSYALILAGGVTPDADLRNIIIRRRVGPGTKTPIAGESSSPTELRVDLWQVIQSGELAADLRIYEGDEIVVPTAQLSSSDQQTLLSSTVAPTNITVQVAGEVQKPGQVQVGATADLNTAVAAAGGPTNDAQESADLFRIGPDGRLTQQTLTLGDDSGPLRDGDIIVLEQRRTVGVLTFLNLLLNPIGDFANLIRLF